MDDILFVISTKESSVVQPLVPNAPPVLFIILSKNDNHYSIESILICVTCLLLSGSACPWTHTLVLCQAGDHVPFAWVSIKSYQRCQSKSAAVRHEIEEESEHVQGDSGSGRAFPQ